MRISLLERFDHWMRAAGFLALVALAWGVFGAGSLFWGLALGAGLFGATIATALVMRDRSQPTLTEVISTAEAEVEPAVVAKP